MAPNSFSVVVVVTVTVTACGSTGTMTIPALALALLVLLVPAEEMLEGGSVTISGRSWDGRVVFCPSDAVAGWEVLVTWLCLLVSSAVPC